MPIVLLSGGINSSTILLDLLNREYEKIHAVSIDYGQLDIVEIKQAKVIAKELRIRHEVLNITVPDQILIENKIRGVNLLLTLFCGLYAREKKIKTIFHGVSKENVGSPSFSSESITRLEETLQYGLNYDVQIKTPYLRKSKVEIIEKMLNFEEGEKILSMTHTCENGYYPPCGYCNQCKIREQAFLKIGRIDPLSNMTIRL